MIEHASFALLRPWWLLAVPAVAALAFALSRRSGALGGWGTAVDPHLMAALASLGRIVRGGRATIWPPALAAVLVAAALAGPAREIKDAPAYRNLDGLVIAIDLSRSIAEGGRLPLAIAAARLVADRAGSRPVALVVFAGDAYLASAFTTDARALGTTVAVLDGETVPDTGSRPERGLALARRLLAEARMITGDAVLVTDGGGISDAALAEAEAIRTAGSRVSTIYVEPVTASPGMPRVARETVDGLAEIGGGVAGDVLEPLRVAESAGVGSASRLAASDLAVLLWTDYGRFLLLLALIPALALFRKTLR